MYGHGSSSIRENNGMQKGPPIGTYKFDKNIGTLKGDPSLHEI